MGFWFFMLLMVLLIPLIMLGFGLYSSKRAPDNINFFFGYRTTMSMKNSDTWVFAHKHCGKLWKKLSCIMLPLSLLIMLFAIKKEDDIIAVYGAVLCIVQLIALMLSIIPTEKALKKNFDENGKRRY
jgi:hypothetical protein